MDQLSHAGKRFAAPVAEGCNLRSNPLGCERQFDDFCFHRNLHSPSKHASRLSMPKSYRGDARIELDLLPKVQGRQ
jgi:hypothetical protein